MLSRLSPTKGVKGDPRGLQCMSIFPSPHPLSSRNLKKALKLPSHRYLPTPTTFHFLPPPYIFVPISPSSLLYQAISPSSLLCTSPLIKCVLRLACVVHGLIYGRFMGCNVNRFYYREKICGLYLYRLNLCETEC